LIDHADPFQNSARGAVCKPRKPTAVHAVDEAHEIADSAVGTAPDPLAVVWRLQAAPFQASATVID